MISNKVNHKMYIGQTRQRLQTRFSQHMCPNSACKALRNAVRKYGRDSFEVLKLTTAATQEEADHLEMLWIRLTHSDNPKYGYNQTSGGSGNAMAFTDDVKRKMSESRKGSGNSFYGRKHTDESRKRMRESHAGQIHYWQEKRVVCIETGKEFKSITEAAKATGLNRTKIGDVCRGDRKSTGGTHWRFA